jgi:hypothetical protein
MHRPNVHRFRPEVTFCILLSMFSSSQTLPDTIKIGGLFDVTDTIQEIAFR